jgi:hypothetical protein
MAIYCQIQLGRYGLGGGNLPAAERCRTIDLIPRGGGTGILRDVLHCAERKLSKVLIQLFFVLSTKGRINRYVHLAKAARVPVNCSRGGSLSVDAKF